MLGVKITAQIYQEEALHVPYNVYICLSLNAKCASSQERLLNPDLLDVDVVSTIHLPFAELMLDVLSCFARLDVKSGPTSLSLLA